MPVTPDTIKVEGGRNLRRTMKRAGVDLGQLKDAHAAAGNIVVGASRVSGPVRSGALVGSLRASKAVASATVRAGGARVPYANVIHWGWPGHNIAAHPWVSDAAQATEPEWSAAYLAAVDRVLATIRGV
jgi:hypothetical protein